MRARDARGGCLYTNHLCATYVETVESVESGYQQFEQFLHCRNVVEYMFKSFDSKAIFKFQV